MKHDYEAIAKEALTQSGKLSTAYKAFWNYSLGNQWLAMMQLPTPEPINTFKGWQSLGRNVKKGQKAIQLLMPVIIKDKETGKIEKTVFIAKNNWFGLSQTEGADYVIPPLPNFDLPKAIKELGVETETFQYVNGNCQGYAKPDKKIIAINPVGYNPTKTTLHELGHVLLHADQGMMNDTEVLANDVKEVEAELVAYICMTVLEQTIDLGFSRGYLQNWLAETTEQKVRYGKVFGAVDKIIKAGREG